MDGTSGAGSRGAGKRWWRRMVAAWTVTGALLAVAVVPAQAVEPPAPSTGLQSCDVLDPAVTTTLDEVRRQIGADAVAEQGRGVSVAVIDTGINPVPGLHGAGKIVDGPDLSFDSQAPGLTYRDLHGHGTNMAAIIAAQGSSSGDGVAPGARLINVKVGAGDGQVDVSQVIAGIDWVVQNRRTHGIGVLNLSFDTDSSQSPLLDPLSHAVENAWNAGIVVVVAAGNDGRDLGRLGNPARNAFVLSVGAAEAEGSEGGWSVPPWSAKGDGVRNPDLIAPGSAVLAPAVAGSFLVENYPNAACADASGAVHLRGSGTSQAAAVVSGAAALLLEQRPWLSPDQVKHLFTRTARPIGKSADEAGQGVLDVAAALAAPTPGREANQTHQRSDGTGRLDSSRGSKRVTRNGHRITGEVTAFGGKWDARAWKRAAASGSAWVDESRVSDHLRRNHGPWKGARWGGTMWMGATLQDTPPPAPGRPGRGRHSREDRAAGSWPGATWSGATWSGATWSGATWSGATWSGATWSGATWSGATWSGATWE